MFPPRRRRPMLVLALALAAMAAPATVASAAGPGGWDHLGDGGTPGSDSLNGAAYTLNTQEPGHLLVGGTFTDAGGIANADRIARWDGSSWSPVSSSSSQIANGAVHAIAYADGKIYAGGTFTDAGGNANADFLAVWNGTEWAPFCNPTADPAPFHGNVEALQIVGNTLYVGGSFQNGAGIPAADYLLACDLTTGASSSTVDTDGDIPGAVYALTSDSSGRLYAAGQFINMDQIPAADHVAMYDGTWHAMGSGPGPGGAAVNDYVRSIASDGTNVYIGSDALDIAGIPQADHVARWDGSAWSAVGSDAAGTNGYFPTSSFEYGMTTSGSDVYTTGSFQNAGGDPLADVIVRFDGTSWHPVGSDGAGNGPWTGEGRSVAVFDGEPYATGNFTSAGGDTQASGIAVYSPPRNLTVQVAGPGQVQGPDFTCPTMCAQAYRRGTVVSLAASAPAGVAFDGWSGSCSGVGACAVTMNADATVTASFHGVPYCDAVSATVPGDRKTTLQLKCQNPFGSVLSYSIVGAPAHGTLGALDKATGRVDYTPKPGYSGPDHFAYRADAPPDSSAPQEMSITVTPAPFKWRVKGKTLRVSVAAPGKVTVSDVSRKKRKILLERSSAYGSPPTISVPLRLSQLGNRRLRRKGRLTVQARITLVLRGGATRTRTAKLTLKRKK